METDTKAAVETKCPQGTGFVHRIVRRFSCLRDAWRNEWRDLRFDWWKIWRWHRYAEGILSEYRHQWRLENYSDGVPWSDDWLSFTDSEYYHRVRRIMLDYGMGEGDVEMILANVWENGWIRGNHHE